MSYIVKGAEMPRKCEDCIFLGFHGAGDYPYCIVTGTKKDCTFIPKLETERMDSCPLVEIPEPKIIAAKMQLIKEKTHDEEIAHITADSLMCELLTELGYGEAVKIFEEMEKWYA